MSLGGGVTVSPPGLLSSKNRDQSGSDTKDVEGTPVSRYIQPCPQSLQQLARLHLLPPRHPTDTPSAC